MTPASARAEPVVVAPVNVIEAKNSEFAEDVASQVIGFSPTPAAARSVAAIPQVISVGTDKVSARAAALPEITLAGQQSEYG